MTCQHCQTWILDEDHRCRRCGRRVRATPSRISPSTYPIAATATAPAYDFEEELDEKPASTGEPVQAGQQTLFNPQMQAASSDGRVIPFESLTSPAERAAIHLRAAETARPAPMRNAKVESKRARTKRTEPADQGQLEFQGREEFLSPPRTHLICDAPVATAGVRVQAALCDAVLMLCGCAIGLGMYLLAGGDFTANKHALPFVAAAILTVPLCYKLLWAFAGRDTPGTRMAGLELVDFDGKRPSKQRLYARLFGSIVSLLAGGTGLIWALVDEDKLTWHDHISGTFPTFRASDL